MLLVRKVIFTILILFLVFSTFPAKNYANQIDPVQGSSQDSQNVNNKKRVGEITKELIDQRTIESKKFQKDDGSYEVAQYHTPVHYLENGKWKDIDNSLEEAFTKDKDGNTNKVLQNKQNDFKVKISKDLNAHNLIEIQKDKFNVSWNLVNAQSTLATIASSDESKLNNEISKSVDEQINRDKDWTKANSKVKKDVKNILVENEKKKTVKKVTSIVNFSNVYNNTDLQYILKGSDIKENIIINKSTDITTFTFNLNATNLTPKLQQDKSIVFYDSTDESKAIFKMQAPFMYDKENNVSNKIDVRLDQTTDGYILSITPDKDWLNSSDRMYPIVIDPSLQTSLDSKNIYDTFVASNDTENKWLNQFVRVGQSTTIGLTRTYIKFTLPQLSSGDMITNATLNLLYSSSVSRNSQVNQINVHKVVQNFDPNNLSWGTQPSYDSLIENFSLVGDSGQDNWEQWDITSIAKQWFTTGNNYGLMLEQDNGGGYSAFYSSDMDNSNAWARPQVTFSYINNSGIENYWTYHTQDVGRAGTSYVNDYNGNLVFTRNDIDMNGSRLPVSINHVFNSNDRNTANTGYGNGWRLNLNQRLEWQDINSTSYYKYTDEDGTRHYFQYSSATEINDELNLGLTLIKETNGTLSIRDKDSNKINFSPSTNDLNNIMDANGNTMTFTYGTTSSNGVRNLTMVTDGAGRKVILNYNGLGILTSIQDNAGRITSYNYDGNGNLVSITDSDNKSSNYSYDGNRNLISATSFDGYKISYHYYGISPYRVSGISESNIDGTLGNVLSIAYGNNSTTFTDVNGRKNVYQFDNFGKTMSIKDVDGSAQYYKAGDTTNSTKLTSESKLEKTVINLLPNHDAETTDSWIAGIDGGSGTSTFSTEASYIGSHSFKITKSDNVSRQYYDYWNSLTKGKTYTFSAYVKTGSISNTNGKGASISFYYKDKSGVFRELNSNSINGTNDWQRLQLTFTLPNDAYDGTVVTRLNMLQESGTAYFDSVQLEEGSVANRYNLIENGDLSGTSGNPKKWSANGTNGSDGLVTTSDSDHPINLDNTVFQVSGAYGVQKKLSQSVNVIGKSGDVYSLGAWSYDGYTYTWDTGDQLAAISGNGQDISYKYNNQGVRTKKIVNGVSTTYHLNGDMVTFETNGTDKIYYTYDANDKLISMNLNTKEYFYVRNVQRDIIGLINESGTNVVSYQYDIWGQVISITGSLAGTVGEKNPFRYRGYRYDNETGLYYLQARYYNPEWGRFLNADSYGGELGGLLSHNVFTYCLNNPVMLVDPSGYRPIEGAMSAFHPEPLRDGARMVPIWKDPIFMGIVGGAAFRSATVAVAVVAGKKKLTTKVVSKVVSKGTNKATPKHSNKNIKDIDAYDDIENFLGKGKQTDINTFTGKKDKDRIFVKQKDGSVRAVRIGDHEMRNPNNQHYHLEQWDKNGNFIRPDQSVKINNSKKR